MFNLEYNTEKYGNVDVDWMITLMAAHYGRAGWLLKGMDPKTIYRIGKPYWIIKDGLTDPDVDIDFSRYGQENEWNAVKAARDLGAKHVTCALVDLPVESISLEDRALPVPKGH